MIANASTLEHWNDTQLLGANGTWDSALAWAYVVLRIIHSLVQATVNRILLRFAIFMVASLAPLALSVRAALMAF